MASFQAVLERLQDLPLSAAIREMDNLFPAIETVHVLAIVLVVGTMARIDLRLLGLASRDRPVTALTREVLPWTWAAFAVALISGGLMFLSGPLKYAGDGSFRIKLVLMALAGINAALFHAFAGRRIAAWDRAAPPIAARLAGGASLILWIAIVAMGRWIGFTAP